jgi:hypothetical protein
MKYYSTELKAIDPLTGELLKWVGPIIPAISWSHAEDFCQNNGFGYLTITGQIKSIVGFTVNDLGIVQTDRIEFHNDN